jgi:RHS repeat-associated protein
VKIEKFVPSNVLLDDGTLDSSMTFYPFGSARSGSVNTDKQFTGQRLDGTGLYYYGARYYDPLTGRFISADPTIPDAQNPQSFNRYSYCLGNPLKYVDPSGLDYIFVGGAGSDWWDDWWIEILQALEWDPTEDRILFIGDSEDGGFEIGDQYNDLVDALQSGEYTDIKLIGHSEGAATVAKVLDKIAEDDSFLADTDVRDELAAAVLLDCPTGWVDFFVLNWDDAALVNLPQRLSDKGISMDFADIYTTWIHSVTREGWEGYSHKISVEGRYARLRHSNICTDEDALQIMQVTFEIE